MAFSELNSLDSNSILLFWTASGIMSHLLAFETLYQTEVFLVGLGMEILATVFPKVINFFNMGGAMVSMVDMGGHFLHGSHVHYDNSGYCLHEG